MPHYRCRSCLVTSSYSAAGHATVGTCPECAAPLAGGSNPVSPGAPTLRRSLPVAA